MPQYSISCTHANAHFLQISLCLEISPSDEITLILPSWRPGRYEIADYAKNLRGLKAYGDDREIIPKKISKNKWILKTSGISSIELTYEYYAFEMTAGTSWVDDEQWYINFINCMLWVDGYTHLPVSVKLNLPDHYKVACALEFKNNCISATNYQELVDSPLFASKNLKHFSFYQFGTTFHLWIQGNINFSIDDFIEDIQKYTAAQVGLFGEFPAENYHYLFQFLPYKYYHGVEHKNSTVITIGPDKDLSKRSLYKELLGVSSHELFHAWNVTRIRPKEMLPYDFSEETYTQTGLITEGLTTFYGDLMLFRSGVFSEEEYLEELSKMLQRHLYNSGRHFSSLVDSSLDLWLDGYKPSAPGRKVSIYTKGALIAWILDLKLKQKGLSLDNVMQELWEKFGDQKSGYSLDDYFEIVHAFLGKDTEHYFDNYVHGTVPIEKELNLLLQDSPYKISWKKNENTVEKTLGIKLDKGGNIILIDPNADAFQKLSIKDKVLAIDQIATKNYQGNSSVVEIKIDRFGRKLSFNIETGDYLQKPIVVRA